MNNDTKPKGYFITLEGGEGAGKSSNLPIVRDWIEQRGHDVVLTREPGGTDAGEQLRTLLMAQEWPGMSELLLMFAARDRHINELILPALEAGKWVVCDRFTDSSYAYQGAARGLGSPAVAQLETLVQQDFRPDLSVIFDLPPEQGQLRTAERGGNNRFDAEALDFHERLRLAFLEQARKAPERYAVIDAGQSRETVAAALVAALDEQWPK